MILGLIGQAILFVLVGNWLLARSGRVRSQSPRALCFDRNASIPLRGLLVSLVVLGHLSKDHFHASSMTWPTAAVAVFMFMSGYGMLVSARGRESWLATMIPNTFGKLLIPLAVVTAGMFIFDCLRGENVLRAAKACRYGMNPWVPYSWYVIELLMLAAIFRCSLGIAGVTRKAVLFMFSGSIGLCLTLRFLLHWQGPWWTSTLAFPVGMAFAFAENRIKGWLLARDGLDYKILAAVSFALAPLLPLLGIITSLRVELLVSALLIGPLVISASYVIPIPMNAYVLYFLGVYSFEIYLMHGCCRKVMVGFAPCGLADLFAILSVPLSLAAAVVLKKGLGFCFPRRGMR